VVDRIMGEEMRVFTTILLSLLFFFMPYVCFSSDIDISKFPVECQGKEITCEQYGVGTCTSMYCPPTVTYDAKGNIIRTTDDCNQCSITRRCWCGGHSFTINK
jgi:hypothetical protein